MEVWRASIRRPILFLIIATLVVAAAVGFYTSQADDLGRAIQTELTDHNQNDGEDECPNDGNAGSGNDGDYKEHPPAGDYGGPPGGQGNPCNHHGRGRPPFCP